MTLLLAVDPGKRSGWALVDDAGTLRDSGWVDASHPEEPQAIVSDSAELGCELLVIEGQHARIMRQTTLERLYYHRHVWEVLAQLRGQRIEVVNPATWQAYWKLRAERACNMESVLTARIKRIEDKKDIERKLMVTKRNKLRSTRQQRFQDSIIKMASVASGHQCEADEADAVLMGLWWEGVNR